MSHVSCFVMDGPSYCVVGVLTFGSVSAAAEQSFILGDCKL